MLTARQTIAQAETDQVAIGHFNISNLETFWGVVKAAQEKNQPIFIGTSEGEREFIGLAQAVALVKSLRQQITLPVFLNADHTYSFEKLKEAVDAGYDSVIIDGAQLSFDENVQLSRKCVEYARSVNPDILVEGELGYIGKSSKVLDDLPAGAAVTEEAATKPEEAAEYVRQTGVDLLAPAVGTVHGMLKKGLNPELHIELIKEIRRAAGVPLVLHGGSGSREEDIRQAIEAGISQVHVSTELRVAYKDALKQALQEHPDEIAPYKYLRSTVQAVSKVVEQKIDLFNLVE